MATKRINAAKGAAKGGAEKHGAAEHGAAEHPKFTLFDEKEAA